MVSPDASMAVVPGVSNARSLQAGAPALYAMVGDTTSTENRWIPSIMPDGKYTGPITAALTAASPLAGTSGGGGGDNTVAIGVGAGVGGGVFVLAVGLGVWYVMQRNKRGEKYPAGGPAGVAMQA